MKGLTKINFLAICLLLLIICISYTSCISTSQFEEGRTLGKQQFAVTGSAGVGERPLTEEFEYFKYDGDIAVPTLQGSFAYGLTNWMDIKVHTNGFIGGMDAKFMLTKRKWPFATSVGFSIYPKAGNVYKQMRSEQLIMLSSANLFTSYYFGDRLSISASTNMFFMPENSKTAYIPSYTFGIEALNVFRNERHALDFGLSYSITRTDIFLPSTISVGLVWNIDLKKRGRKVSKDGL